MLRKKQQQQNQMHVACVGVGDCTCNAQGLKQMCYIPLSLFRITQRAINHYLLKNILVINIFKNNYLHEEKDKHQLSSKL